MGVARRMIGAFSAIASPSLLALQRRRGAGVILLYHRVSTGEDPVYPPLHPEHFAEHLTLLRKSFAFLPLGEMVERVRAGRSLAGCAAVTFDDGYRDFLEHAYKVLKAQDVPATHFLVADSVELGLPTWNLRLRRLMRDGAEHAARAAELARLPRNERYAWLDARETAEDRAAWPAMLRADDLAQCDPDLVEWGSHTVSHTLLAEAGEGMAQWEIAESRDRLERLTGKAPRHLSYPNASFTGRTAELARAAGYEAAFAVGQQEVRAGEDLFAIGRFDVGALPTGMVMAEASGAVQALRRLRGGTAA